MKLAACIESIGLIGPGLADWPHAREVLAGRAPYQPEPTMVPAPASLPSAERRRTGAVVRLALAAGLEAVAASKQDVTSLATIFTASGGDGHNCSAICEMLAGDDRLLSPTRFHNSVHNAPAGYWSIATRAVATSNVLCAHDGSFAAGLLEALCQTVVDDIPTLLIAYDAQYPEPLHATRPLIDGVGIALVLVPARLGSGLPRIEAVLADAPAAAMASPALEALRTGNPAARALPLLEALAAERSAELVLDYLPDTRLRLDLSLPQTEAQA